MSRARPYLLIWLLVFSTLAAALLPPVAHAFIHKHVTDTGSVLLGNEFGHITKVLEHTSFDEQDSDKEFCAYCTQLSISGFPVTSTFQRDLRDSRIAFVPPLYLFARCALFAWLTPSSRAPPLFLS